MSSGVPEQPTKTQLQPGKNVEEQNIPWSQQVDEASYENLPSPTDVLPDYTKHSSVNSSTYNNARRSNYEHGSRGSHYVNANTNFSKKNNNSFEASCRPNKNSYGSDNYKVHDKDTRTISTDKHDFKTVSKPSTSSPNEGNKSNTQVPKKMTWASIASQPAKLTLRPNSSSSTIKKKGPGMPPPPMVPGKHNMDIGTWDTPNNRPALVPPTPPMVVSYPITEQNAYSSKKDVIDEGRQSIDGVKNSVNENKDPNSLHKYTKIPYQNSGGQTHESSNEMMRPPWMSQQQSNHSVNNAKPVHFNKKTTSHHGHVVQHETSLSQNEQPKQINVDDPSVEKPKCSAQTTLSESDNIALHPVLDKLRDRNNYNPSEIDLGKAELARFFVIKSYSEDDIHRSIKYEIWCSTDHGNKKLDDAFREREQEKGFVFLLFSVNGSGYFCGMAQMLTPVDYNSISSVWAQDKWRGKFKVKWIYVKDVPNGQFRHIRLENNEYKSVTNSRDAQEVPNAKGVQVLKILHSFNHGTSIFDDFYHYEKRQEAEQVSRKQDPPVQNPNASELNSSHGSTSSKMYRQVDDNDREKNPPQNKFSGGGGGGYRERYNFNRGSNYHGNDRNYYESRRNDSYNRSGGGFEHATRDNGERVNLHYNQNRETSEYNNRGSRYDYNKREDREMRSNSKHNRDFHHDKFNNSGGFASRGDMRSSGGYKDNYNKDMDHQNRDGRGRGHRN